VFGVARQRIGQRREQRRSRFCRQGSPCRKRVARRFNGSQRFCGAAQGRPAPHLATPHIADIKKGRRHGQVGVAIDPQGNGQDFIAFGHHIP
jgi:hypothetical protein